MIDKDIIQIFNWFSLMKSLLLYILSFIRRWRLPKAVICIVLATIITRGKFRTFYEKILRCDTSGWDSLFQSFQL